MTGWCETVHTTHVDVFGSPFAWLCVPARAIPTTVAMTRWARAHELPVVDFYPITRDEFDDPSSHMNPDGIHWGFRCHARLAEAVAVTLGDIGR